ncbi:chromosome partitioning protein ParB [Streptomyces griseoviridis]|uniref:Chromosome partitioning protein ParB n=1 Tax=Streptomyces griseoviridis TaxID=45398 RepID=A0A3Q9KYB4_STRGD|nr:ParB/Srx family N-terminal domain-containing protein [Streptomyces griseoviridis]AZS88713.1 chromosome partitioning protein ParB [Streptomyces griseoviridis]QCN84447.1 chromosome partitioning protein ParB [Streptomyces griseoviridis]
MTGSARVRPARSAVASRAPGRRGLARGAGVLTCSLLIGQILTGTPAAAQSGTASGVTSARAGDLIDVTLDQLRPTQPSLGYDQIFYKLGRYGSSKDEDRGKFNKRFDDWCETNGQGVAASVDAGAALTDPSSFTCAIPVGQETEDSLAQMKTVVVGPGGTLYLTDGHHSLTSFWEAADGGPKTPIRLRVSANLSRLSTADFWKRMRAENWVWLKDEKGDAITVSQLPTRLGLSRFHDDPYRSLVYFTRGIGYEQANGSAEFLEFLWGGWLRDRIDLSRYDLTSLSSSLDAVRDASKAMTDLPGDTVVAGGRTADELGRLAEWNAGKKETKGEFGDLSLPLSDSKPGKLAFALDYRSRVPATPACTRTVTGQRAGALLVTSGTTCLDNARLTGVVLVTSGASLVVRGSDITGAVQTVGADTVQICGSSLTGALSVVGTRSAVTLSGPGCTANTFRGPVSVTGTKGA